MGRAFSCNRLLRFRTSHIVVAWHPILNAYFWTDRLRYNILSDFCSLLESFDFDGKPLKICVFSFELYLSWLDHFFEYLHLLFVFRTLLQRLSKLFRGFLCLLLFLLLLLQFHFFKLFHERGIDILQVIYLLLHLLYISLVHFQVFL